MRTLALIAILATMLVIPAAALSPRAPRAALDLSGRVRATVSRDDQASRVAEDTRRATAILEELRAKYRGLDGVTVSVGATPEGEEAVAYYTKGQILIDRHHSVSVQAILAHEVWHIIDWRDNHRLDWGEDLPPGNSYLYVRE